MRFRTLSNWKNPASLEGLLFFSQLLEELLFDYSLDSYKPSAMNSSSLCSEGIMLIRDIEAEVIDKANLSHVLDELVSSLRKDEIAKSLLDINVEVIASGLNESNTLQERKTLLEIVYSQINPFAYKSQAEIILTDAVKNGNEKNRITSLTRSYVTTLISIGYSTRYLYPSVRWAFHSPKNKITSFSDIANYFNLVDGASLKYAVVFEANKIFRNFKKSCEDFDVYQSDILSTEYQRHATTRKFSKKIDSTYLVVKELEVMDVYSARNRAEKLLETISTLANLFHHKEVPTWERKALVINLSTATPRLVNSSNNPMLMCPDNRVEKASVKLNRFLDEFSLREEHSFQKFIRATELHTLALKNDSSENQLLNLWVGLETLTPSNLTQNKPKIRNVSDSVLPFISLSYLDTLTNRLTKDFKNWNVGAFNKHTKSIPGANDREKLIRLLVLDEFEANKDALYIDLGQFYLLRNRADYFSTILKSTKKISDLLDRHWIRVDWQLRRIYRARNFIVHAGHTPAYIDILIKNTHDYLDLVTNGIVALASKGEKINTVDQAFKYAEIQHVQYKQQLLEKVPVDSGNIVELLFTKRI